MSAMHELLLGAIAMGSLVAALFFMRFWRETHDRFFLLFASAFLIDAADRVALVWAPPAAEHEPLYYSVRLVMFGLIIVAIVDKNRTRNHGAKSAGTRPSRQRGAA
jgi:hypothetical protein